MCKKVQPLSLIIAVSVVCDMASGLKTQSLLGNGWQLTSGDQQVEASLPAHALQALQDAGSVPDPLYRYNEQELRWVAEREWAFERRFEVSDSFLAARQIDLLLSGVDTVADISLNDQHLLSTDSAFREYRIAVKDGLLSGSNVLRIVIQPAIEAVTKRAAAHPYDIPAQQGPGMAAHMNFLRKPACDFGWDWGPCFAPSGIFGKIELVAYNHAHLTGASTRQRWQADGSIELVVTAQLLVPTSGDAGVLKAWLPSCNATASREVYLQQPGEHPVSLKMRVPAGAALWWPRGYGQPTLHQLNVSFERRSAHTLNVENQMAQREEAAEESRTSTGQSLGEDRALGEEASAISSLQVKAAEKGRQSECSQLLSGCSRLDVEDCRQLKRVELMRDPLEGGRAGETFYFEVNGVPIFIKGSNVIPSDVFRARETPEKERSLVQAAVTANMNTIRVWGGGHYPSDALMAACDEAGILVWLEAMFGCALYPREPAFLKSVALEIRQQAFRLAGHASVLCMGGNNEVENSFGWFKPSQTNPNLYSVDFDALFVRTIIPALNEVAADIIYLDSSPSNGLHSDDPWIKRWGDTQDPNYGDVHFYNYEDNAFDPNTYPRAKFVSEFGFQSFPSFSSYSRVTTPEDWAWNSTMSEYRQRHPNGQLELKKQLMRHFQLGNALQPGESGFRRWIYLTQIQQALVYDTAVRSWRRIKQEPDARTMGVLYWQHNDIWCGPSWSGINYDGSWKLLHYAAARFFDPFIVSGHHSTNSSGGSTKGTSNGTASVYITSDVPSQLSGTIEIEVVPWAATEAPAASKRHTFSLPALGSQLTWEQDVDGLLQPLNLQPEDAFLRVTASATAADSDATTGGTKPDFRSTTECWLSEFKCAGMKEPQLSVSAFRQISSTEVAFQVHSKEVAAGVAIETDVPGRFSDNALLVLPWASVQLRFHADANISASQLEESISLTSVYAPAAL